MCKAMDLCARMELRDYYSTTQQFLDVGDVVGGTAMVERRGTETQNSKHSMRDCVWKAFCARDSFKDGAELSV